MAPQSTNSTDPYVTRKIRRAVFYRHLVAVIFAMLTTHASADLQIKVTGGGSLEASWSANGYFGYYTKQSCSTSACSLTYDGPVGDSPHYIISSNSSQYSINTSGSASFAASADPNCKYGVLSSGSISRGNQSIYALVPQGTQFAMNISVTATTQSDGTTNSSAGASAGSAGGGMSGTSFSKTYTATAGPSSAVFDGQTYYLVDSISATSTLGVNNFDCKAHAASSDAEVSISLHPIGPLLNYFSGSGQTTTVSTSLSKVLKVQVVDGQTGAALSGIPVGFTFTSQASGVMDGKIISVSNGGVSDSKGFVSAVAQLGTATGAYTITANCPQCVSQNVTFSETAVSLQAGTALKEMFCDGSHYINTPLPDPLRGVVYNIYTGKPVSGINVDFTEISGPASISPTAATSNKYGVASSNLTLGSAVGVYQIDMHCADCLAHPDVYCIVGAILPPDAGHPNSPLGPIGARSTGGVTITATPSDVVPSTESGSPLVTGMNEATISLQSPVANAPCRVDIFPVQYSGGHGHQAIPDPYGSIDSLGCTTDANGSATFKYMAGIAGGQVEISATVSGAGSANAFINVGVPGLSSLPPNPDYLFVSHDRTHPSFNYGSSHLNAVILQAAVDYMSAKNARLSINDMSLINGGLFDIGGTWSPPHVSHRKGTSVDLNHSLVTVKGIRKIVPLDTHYTDFLFGGAGCGRCVEAGSIHYECPATIKCPIP